MKKLIKNLAFVTLATSAVTAVAQTPSSRTEPVYRISKNEPAPAPAVHPLDPAIQLARHSLTHSQATIKDYTAILIKREQIDGVVGEYEYMFAKVRNRQVDADGQVVVPFSVYLQFLKPANIKGREVLYVEGANDGHMIAHEGGVKRMLGTHSLDPKGWLAMKGQRYPVTEIGIENLLVKLLEKGTRDRAGGDCKVEFMQGAKVSGRPCRVIQITHPTRNEIFDFHIAQVFLDEELQVPVRLAAFDWPATAGAEPQILEEYTYQNIKINVGLTDKDFDQTNEDYAFRR